MASPFDPLKIVYIVALATDDPHDVTPFQGFSVSWETVSWALDLICGLPADVLERTHKIEHIIALRMGGVRPLAWAPLGIKYLKDVAANELVLLSQKVAADGEKNHLFGKIHTSARGGWNGSAKIERWRSAVFDLC